MPGRGGGRGKISYIQQSEPSFIQAFKQRVGYKEGPTVDTKREELGLSDDDKSDGEDEKPVVVVLKEGDLTAEEADRLQEAENDTPAGDGKIVFRKPVKRNAEKVPEDEQNKTEEKTEKKRKKKKSSKENKSSLLSFDDEENDDG